jgi:hypothetical protein
MNKSTAEFISVTVGPLATRGFPEFPAVSLPAFLPSKFIN